MNFVISWRDEYKSHLEQRMGKIVSLLGDYEMRLIDESDPQAKSRLKTQIAELKEQMCVCQSDLDSLTPERENHKDLALKMANITYDDINFVITALLNQRMVSIDTQDSYQPTNPDEKMSRNGLTHKVKFLLDMGLAKAGEVRHFIENNAKVNFPDVPEKLKQSLNSEYTKLVKEGLKGDELFLQLYRFSSHNNQDPSRQAAGLAVLCYFFETCDVFES